MRQGLFSIASRLFFIAFCITLFGCQQSKNNADMPKEITVSAAASLREAFREIGKIYEEREKIRVNFNFAASGALQKQIEQGAPADVFASAGKPQMDALVAQNLIAAETRRDFVRNELVLIVNAAQNTKSNSFIQFLENERARLAVGNPKTVPAGIYAEQSLRRLGVWEKLQTRLVFAEDVRQVLDYVARGEVEAGVVYNSDARIAGEKVRIAARAPENSHEAILYPIAVVKNSKNRDAAGKFVELVLSSEGQAILQKYGFLQIQ